MLQIPSRVWPRWVWRVITRSHCWHCSYGRGAPCVSIVWCTLFNPGHRSGWLAAFTQDQKVLGKKPEKELVPRRPCGCSYSRGQSRWPESSLQPASAVSLFFTSWIKDVGGKDAGRCRLPLLQIRAKLDKGARRAAALALGSVWSPPALWCVASGKSMGSLGAKGQAATMQGLGCPTGCPITAAPAKTGIFPRWP